MGRHSYDPGQEPRPTPRLRVAHGGLTDIGLLRAVNKDGREIGRASCRERV